MDRWGGAAAIKLLAIGRNTANRVTTDREGKPGHRDVAAPTCGPTSTAAGHGNEFHSHPGSFWSGVYYVDDGGIAADPSLGGELEFMDPRGPGPAMYAPHLAFAMPARPVGRRQRDGAAQGRPPGDVPGLAAAPGAALSRQRRAHLHRLQPQPVSASS